MLDIKESIGMCRCCGKDETLGNGLCQNCWDKGENTELSDREKEVLRYIATGAENMTIAAKLSVSCATVEYHIQSLMRKIYTPKGINKRVWLAVNAAQLLYSGGDVRRV